MMPEQPSIKVVLGTSLSLIDQFIASIDLSQTHQGEATSSPSPLHLLLAAATAIKSTTTKLSLLTITAPFTASAVVSTLQPLNTATLPSLVTATLLTSPAQYPESFALECKSLTIVLLRHLKSLLLLISARAEDGQPKEEVKDAEKQKVTSATGVVWEDCDFLTQFAKDDIGGFIVRKATIWLELMQDAVKELEEWDPEEEDVEDQDWLGLDAGAISDDDDDDGSEADHEKKADPNRSTISAGVKSQALKVLSRVPQSIHVVVKQRLKKYPTTASAPNEPAKLISTGHKATLGLVLKRIREISDCIDESAEAMYLGDPELCLKKAGKARALTIRVVEATLEPWVKQDGETREDQYMKKALVWIQQVDTGPLPAGNEQKNDSKEAKKNDDT